MRSSPPGHDPQSGDPLDYQSPEGLRETLSCPNIEEQSRIQPLRSKYLVCQRIFIFVFMLVILIIGIIIKMKIHYEPESNNPRALNASSEATESYLNESFSV